MQSATNSEQNVEGNPIGSLQEMCATWGWPLPIYNVVSEIGLPHEKDFTIECKMLQRRKIGKGKTKKLAKKIAANKMWIDIQERPINRIEIKILKKEQNQKYPVKNGQKPMNYVRKDFSTKSKTKAGPSNSSSKFTGRTYPKFRNNSQNSVKERPIMASSAKNKSDTIVLDNNIIKGFKNLYVSNEMQEYPRNATLDDSNEKENTKQVGETMRKTWTPKSKKCSPHKGEDLERISLQEVNLYSERNVPFKAMGLKREMAPSNELSANSISKEQSLSEIPMKNKSNNFKTVVTSNSIGHLQEMCVARGWPKPEYTTVSEFGLSGIQFKVECKILEHRETGEGKNKKSAKQLAALSMWSKLEEHSLDTKQ